jgi:hypothetical protein
MLESMRSRYRPRGYWLKRLYLVRLLGCKKFTSKDRNSLVGPASGGVIHRGPAPVSCAIFQALLYTDA